jgi:hypothetical protein
MDNPDESSIRYEMVKGVIFSQLALIVTLLKAGLIAKGDIVKELDNFIEYMAKAHPDAIFFLDPARTLKDAISALSEEIGISNIDFDSLFSGPTGDA